MILVTGATGLVGSHLLYKLVSEGQPVKAIYRNPNKIEAVKRIFSYYTKTVDSLFEKIQWIEANINHITQLEAAFGKVTYVYHCAAFISFDAKDYYSLRKINIEGTANIANLCLAYGVTKLCYVSSVAAVGSATNNNHITENSPWNADNDHSVYAITKYGAEMEVWRASQEGLDVVIVNPGIILGPGFWYSGSSSLFRTVYKGLPFYTTGINGYVGVRDTVTLMVQLMQSHLKNERFILVSENMSFKDFASQVAQALQVNSPKRKASSFLLSLYWRVDWLRSMLKNKRRRLTKQVAKSLTQDSVYSNRKVCEALSFTFTPIEKSIKWSSQVFLSEL